MTTTEIVHQQTMPYDDYDNPWKDVIERFFRDFLEFFFPLVARGIDWDKEYTFIDKELQKIIRDAKEGKLYADKLVRVYLLDGNVLYVIIHIEIQSQEQAQFALRMMVYNCRLRDLYNVPIVSLAVLGDERLNWRPNTVTEGMWGCDHTFTFPLAKLVDYREHWAELEASTNPFATVVMAHLKTQQTRNNHDERKQWKVTLIRQLYQKGYTENKILGLLRFLDWIMWLPNEVNSSLWQEELESEEVKNMAYVTTIERIIDERYQQGLMEGIGQGLQLAIKLRFGNEERVQSVIRHIQRINDLALLQQIVHALETATNLEDIQALYTNNMPTIPEHPPTA